MAAQHHQQRSHGSRTAIAGAPPGPGPMRETDSVARARKASGAAIAKAERMPAVAMASVRERFALASSARKAGSNRGGKKPARKPPITAQAVRGEQQPRA
jgi:hypothetical protein